MALPLAGAPPNDARAMRPSEEFRAEALFDFGAPQFLQRLWMRRRRTAIVELAALAQIIPSAFPPCDGSQRFLANYCLARELDARAFAHVMGSPYALVWLRRVFECVRVHQGNAPLDTVRPHMAAGQTLQDYWHELLDQLGILVAATLIRTGQTLALPAAVPLKRPTTLAATTWHLAPRGGTGSLNGVSQGTPHGDDFEAVRLGSLTVREREIVIDPADDFLALEAREGASREAGYRTAADFRRSMVEALELFRSGCPGVIDEIALCYYAVAPSLIGCPTGFPSGTTSTSLGLSAFSMPYSPTVLCEMLVHELSHAHLFAYQDIDPVLEPASHGEGWSPEDLYSPWRDDARPANGVLHAVFVFSRVAAMWLAFVRSGAADLDLARRRLAALRYQLRIGAGVLQESVAWTAPGRKFWTALQTSVNEIDAACAGLDLDSVEPRYAEVACLGRFSGTAKERQREHYRNWRKRNPGKCVIADQLVNAALN